MLLLDSMVVKTESREPSDNKQQTGLKSLRTQAPSGGLFGIDQEVVTLRGLYGNSGHPDRPASGGIKPLLTGSVRAVAPGVETPEAPLRATRSKSQPPHLVFEHPNYCHQNFASDHLLSGVNSHLKLAGELLSIVPE